MVTFHLGRALSFQPPLSASTHRILGRSLPHARCLLPVASRSLDSPQCICYWLGHFPWGIMLFLRRTLARWLDTQPFPRALTLASTISTKEKTRPLPCLGLFFHLPSSFSALGIDEISLYILRLLFAEPKA